MRTFYLNTNFSNCDARECFLMNRYFLELIIITLIYILSITIAFLISQKIDRKLDEFENKKFKGKNEHDDMKK